ncbi:hypothetical protein OEB96_01405 [Paraliomyxa miuraensis]|nr:hypothetical protein [Paraliomyxa miuraensis]
MPGLVDGGGLVVATQAAEGEGQLLVDRQVVGAQLERAAEGVDRVLDLEVASKGAAEVEVGLGDGLALDDR